MDTRVKTLFPSLRYFNINKMVCFLVVQNHIFVTYMYFTVLLTLYFENVMELFFEL